MRESGCLILPPPAPPIHAVKSSLFSAGRLEAQACIWRIDFAVFADQNSATGRWSGFEKLPAVQMIGWMRERKVQKYLSLQALKLETIFLFEDTFVKQAETFKRSILDGAQWGFLHLEIKCDWTG